MSSSAKSSVQSLQTKRRNYFYSWYAELCRISNINPILLLNSPNAIDEAVLDFFADRIKAEEWRPILNALCLDTSLCFISIKSRCNKFRFYSDIDTEEKLSKMRKNSSLIRTDYIVKSVLKSIGCCLKNSMEITCLELENVILSSEHLALLLQNLRFNRTITVLSLKQSPLKDEGCQMICTNLRLLPNIQILNLSSCDLGTQSGINIAKIIKHQQFNRRSGNWNKEDNQSGLKRITIDNNPDIGDEGLEYILDVLDNDLWLKAIDMRNCGITDNMSNRLLNLVEQTTSLEIADFRNNDNLSLLTLAHIYEIFEKKHESDNTSEFEWDAITINIERKHS